MQHEPVGLRAVTGDELDPFVQDASDERDVARQPVQFRHHQRGTRGSAVTQGSRQLGPVGFAPGLNFRELGQQASTADMGQHGNPLGFEPQTALALFNSRNPVVRDEPCHAAPCP